MRTSTAEGEATADGYRTVKASVGSNLMRAQRSVIKSCCMHKPTNHKSCADESSKTQQTLITDTTHMCQVY